jgi:hypothetical protein
VSVSPDAGGFTGSAATLQKSNAQGYVAVPLAFNGCVFGKPARLVHPSIALLDPGSARSSNPDPVYTSIVLRTAKTGCQVRVRRVELIRSKLSIL